MRFITYVEDDGDRVGVVSDGLVHALAPGVTLLDLLRSGQELHEAGDRALATPSAVRSYADVQLRAPVPDPPTIRDFMTFERHVELSLIHI